MSARHVGASILAPYAGCVAISAMQIPTYRAVISTQPLFRINPVAPKVPSPETSGGE